jgi:hypothetical protein
VALYDELLVVAPSPVVELDRAIAVGMRDGPGAGLALFDAFLRCCTAMRSDRSAEQRQHTNAHRSPDGRSARGGADDALSRPSRRGRGAYRTSADAGHPAARPDLS